MTFEKASSTFIFRDSKVHQNSKIRVLFCTKEQLNLLCELFYINKYSQFCSYDKHIVLTDFFCQHLFFSYGVT